ncbi:MAG: inositol monophosphatase family protein [Thermoplasmata archaeon]
MKEIKEAMLRAAEEVQEVFRRHIKDVDAGMDAGIGASGSPSEKIDILCEEAAISVLKETGISILSEEQGFIDKRTQNCFVLDPLDGTINAVNGLPFCAFSLAYGGWKLSNMKMGIVKNLITGDTFWAEQGRGAFLNGVQITTREFSEKNCIVLVYIGKHASQDAFKLGMAGKRTRCFGAAALELAFLAAGFADIYFMKNEEIKRNLRITDIAAGTLILREAGGIALDDTLNDLDMPIDINARRGVLCAGRKEGIEFAKKILGWK